MYLRRYRRCVDGEFYEYWSLVKSARTARGPRQRTAAFIGKEPGLDRRARVWAVNTSARSWMAARVRMTFLEGAQPDAPEWATVDVSRVGVERLRDFGAAYLGVALWRRIRSMTTGCTARL